MPYVDESARRRLTHPYSFVPQTSGELNYEITRLVIAYLQSQRAQNSGTLRYAHLNGAMGALAGAQAELYRRVGGPLEDAAIVKNGDVYPVELTGPQDECGRSELAARRDLVEHIACGTDDCCQQCDTAQAPDHTNDATLTAAKSVRDTTVQVTHYEPVIQAPGESSRYVPKRNCPLGESGQI